MNISKDSIKQRFSKACASYENSANVQAIMGQELIYSLEDLYFTNILEIGAGTGLLSENICNSLCYSKFVVNDICDEMLACCKERLKEYPNLEYLNCDAEHLPITEKEQFDLIISNACFQWFDNLKQSLEALKDLLTVDGVLAFSIFTEGNFEEIKKCSGISLDYLSSVKLREILKQVFTCYTLKSRTFVLYFEDVKSLLKTLKKAGVTGLSGQVWSKGRMQQFIDNYEKNYRTSKGLRLTYKCYYVMAYK